MHMHLSFWMRACAMTSVIRVTVYVTRARRGARAPPAPLYSTRAGVSRAHDRLDEKCTSSIFNLGVQ